ncbi:MAG: hypothetical protein SGJ02_04635, partial [bacterium]|nr:hypothetical protein [bacterium]
CQDNQEINLGQQSFSSTGSPSVSNKLGEDLSLLDPKLGDIITRIRNEENSGTKQIYPHSGRMAILDELIEFFDGAKDNLFIAEKRNSDIQRVTMSDNTVAFALQERMFFDEDPKIQLAAASAFNHFRLNSAIKGILFDGVMHHENPEVAIECINVIDSLSLSRGYAQTLKLYGQELFTKLVTETKRFPNVIRRAKLTLKDWKSVKS